MKSAANTGIVSSLSVLRAPAAVLTLVIQLDTLLFSVDNRVHNRKTTEKTILLTTVRLALRKLGATNYNTARDMFPQFMTMQEKQMLAKTVRIHKQNCG